MTLGPYIPDPRDYFVEWQMPDRPGPFIDLAATETEVLLPEDAEVRTTSEG